MNVDEWLMCKIDMKNKCVDVDCPTRGDKIDIRTIVFLISEQVDSSGPFNFEWNASTGCEKLREYLSEHFVELVDTQGKRIPSVDLTEYDWKVQLVPTSRGNEWAGKALRG